MKTLAEQIIDDLTDYPGPQVLQEYANCEYSDLGYHKTLTHTRVGGNPREFNIAWDEAMTVIKEDYYTTPGEPSQ